MHRREMREERRACRDAVRGNFFGAAFHQQRADRIHFQPDSVQPNLGVGAAVAPPSASAAPPVWAPTPLAPPPRTHPSRRHRRPVADAGAACSRAATTGCLHEGWLFKRAVSATIYKNWKRRWLVVWPDRIEWRDAPGAPVKGAILLDEAARLTPSAGLYMVVQRGEAELMLRTSCAMDLQVWWDAIAEALRGTAVHPHRPGRRRHRRADRDGGARGGGGRARVTLKLEVIPQPGSSASASAGALQFAAAPIRSRASTTAAAAASSSSGGSKCEASSGERSRGTKGGGTAWRRIASASIGGCGCGLQPAPVATKAWSRTRDAVGRASARARQQAADELGGGRRLEAPGAATAAHRAAPPRTPAAGRRPRRGACRSRAREASRRARRGRPARRGPR